jgi:hypothetical protein
MDQVIFLDTAEAPEVTLDYVGGDLRLAGWDQREFHAESDDERTLTGTTDQARGLIQLTAKGDVTVRVPRRARVKIQHVEGDAKLKAVEGALTIEFIGGDLVLRQTGPAALGEVKGDLSAKKIGGGLSAREVNGDVSARSVAGPFSADEVSGDLYLRDIAGPAHAQAGGDVILGLEFQPGQPYQFEAGGDLLCRIAPGASAKLSIEAGGDVEVEVPGAQLSGDEQEKIVTLGAGAALVNLQADGDVNLTSTTPDPQAMGEVGEHFGEEFGVMAEEFSAQIEAQIESQMADLEKQLSDKLGSLNLAFGANSAKAEQIAARARRAAEHAAERVAASARRGTQHAGRRFGPRPPLPPTPPGAPRLFAVGKMFGHAPASDPVTDAERMSILRMVEQKKISIAEAEKLLAALEGKA